MRKLFKVTCCGKGYGMGNNTLDVYVVAGTETEASNKALEEMIKLQYDKVDDYVSNVELIADEGRSNNLLVI